MAKGKSDLTTDPTQSPAPEPASAPTDMQVVIERVAAAMVEESVAALKEWIRREVHLAMQGHSPETRAKLNP